MTIVEFLQAAGDLTTNAILLLVMWQGLIRFDRLLDLVIVLAARSNLAPDEMENLRVQILQKPPINPPK